MKRCMCGHALCEHDGACEVGSCACESFAVALVSAPAPEIVVREVSSGGLPAYMADGPDGHYSLLMRGTREQAARDGLDYFLRTRKYAPEFGRWVVRGLS